MLYQIIVIGLGLTLLFGGGYYIAQTDTNGVLRSTLSEEKKSITEEDADMSQEISSSTSESIQSSKETVEMKIRVDISSEIPFDTVTE